MASPRPVEALELYVFSGALFIVSLLIFCLVLYINVWLESYEMYQL